MVMLPVLVGVRDRQQKGDEMKQKTLEKMVHDVVEEAKRKRKNGLTIENLAKKGIKKPKPRHAIGTDFDADTLRMTKTPWDHVQEKAGAMKVKNEP